MRNYIQPGEIIQFSNSGSAISSGDPVVIGNRIGVAVVDIAATSGTGAVQLDGVFELAKDGDESFSIGDALFFDSSDSTLTKTATGNKWAGIAAEAAESSAVLCRVLLCPMPKQMPVQAAVATADGSDAATTQALANALKTAHNDLLTKLKASGLMANS